MAGGVTRCRAEAMKAVQRRGADDATLKSILSEYPEACPHPDCSPGGCRAQVREILLAARATRDHAQNMGWHRRLRVRK